MRMAALTNPPRRPLETSGTALCINPEFVMALAGVLDNRKFTMHSVLRQIRRGRISLRNEQDLASDHHGDAIVLFDFKQSREHPADYNRAVCRSPHQVWKCTRTPLLAFERSVACRIVGNYNFRRVKMKALLILFESLLRHVYLTELSVEQRAQTMRREVDSAPVREIEHHVGCRRI